MRTLLSFDENLRGSLVEAVSTNHEALVAKETTGDIFITDIKPRGITAAGQQQQQQRDIAGEWLRDIGFRCLGLYN